MLLKKLHKKRIQAESPCQYKHNIPVSSFQLTASSSSCLWQQIERMWMNQYIVLCRTATYIWWTITVLGMVEFVATYCLVYEFIRTVVLGASVWSIKQHGNLSNYPYNISGCLIPLWAMLQSKRALWLFKEQIVASIWWHNRICQIVRHSFNSIHLSVFLLIFQMLLTKASWIVSWFHMETYKRTQHLNNNCVLINWGVHLLFKTKVNNLPG